MTNIDDDAAGITVTPTIGLVTTEGGGTATFTIVLNAQPVADVTIGLSSSDTTEGTVPASVTFTTLHAVVDGSVAYSIITAPAASGDAAYVGLDAADVSVTNSDDDAGVLAFAVDAITVAEPVSGNVTATFTITLSTVSTLPVTVDYSTEDQTAVAGTDYVAAAGTLTFAPGETSKTVSVTVIGDGAMEAAETFALALTNATGATISGTGRAVATIQDVVVPIPTASGWVLVALAGMLALLGAMKMRM